MVKRDVRGGAELRKRVRAVKSQKSGRYPCPVCGKKSVKRMGYAQWRCRSCGAHFAGGAYSPSTPLGRTASRILESIKKGLKASAEEVLEVGEE